LPRAAKNALREIAERISTDGGQAVAVMCDVADRHQVEQVAETAISMFGRIDTWVNNAGQGLYGRLDQVTDEDNRRLFDVNFWGLVYGSLVALPHLRKQGGALINVGSEVSEAYVPLLGMYTASKHAVKGFTDSLRVEVEDVDKAQVSITLIQPTAVNTPFPQHARNYQQQEPKLPDPTIEPAQVADAILKAATTPTRDHRVGWNAKVNTTMATLMPSMADRMVAGLVDKQHYDEPPRRPEGTLRQPCEKAGAVGQTHGTGGRVAK
jgi:short-subunit dehydrogenase